jgi:chromosome segregation ATPase
VCGDGVMGRFKGRRQDWRSTKPQTRNGVAELKEQLVGLRLKTQELTFTNTELEASLERCRKDLTVCNGKLQEASELLASSTAQSDLDALKKIIREKDDYISELKRTIEEGEQRVAREREALRKARDALYESQRKTEEVEEMIPRLQVCVCVQVRQQLQQLQKSAEKEPRRLAPAKSRACGLQERRVGAEARVVRCAVL